MTVLFMEYGIFDFIYLIVQLGLFPVRDEDHERGTPEGRGRPHALWCYRR